MSLTAKCPSCGADITFKVSTSWVLVCEFCRHVIGRGDQQLEDYGKSADLVDSQSPLERGACGTYRGQRFAITGRLQLLHDKGGRWDEWYALFDDGTWGWLAEAQGKFILTFEEARLPEGFVTSERGTATYGGGEGEIPFRVKPGERFDFEDLQGPDSGFATIDRSEAPPKVFVGREVTLAELGLAGRAPAERTATRIKAVSVNCPECDGALELRAPETERVGCPYCGALSDVNQGKLRLLKTLDKFHQEFTPDLTLGTRGTIRGHEMTVIGFLVRSVTFDGVRYFWSEYLLYEAKIGFRWLVHSDGHWSFVEPVSVADARENMKGAVFRGKTFKVYQRATATVAWVIGEFYWKVKQHDKAETADFIAPPLMLSKEEDGGETTWSLGHYVPAADVEKGFGLARRSLGRTMKVAPNQPYAHDHVLKLWPLLLVLGGILALVSCARGKSHPLSERIDFPELESPQATRVWFSEPFLLERRKNIRVAMTAERLANEWAYVQGDLVNETTGLVVPFSLEMSRYSGVEGGESWSEGSRDAKKMISAVPEGLYVLRLEGQWGPTVRPLTLDVRVEQSVPRPVYALVLLGALSLIPLGVLVHRMSFERRRWADSDFSPYGGGDDEE